MNDEDPKPGVVIDVTPEQEPAAPPAHDDGGGAPPARSIAPTRSMCVRTARVAVGVLASLPIEVASSRASTVDCGAGCAPRAGRPA